MIVDGTALASAQRYRLVLNRDCLPSANSLRRHVKLVPRYQPLTISARDMTIAVAIMPERKRVAIIGSGCAGLGAAWALQSTQHEVHLFERGQKLGGHTNTQTWTHDGESTPVDTGFIVMNSATYRKSSLKAIVTVPHS